MQPYVRACLFALPWQLDQCDCRRPWVVTQPVLHERRSAYPGSVSLLPGPELRSACIQYLDVTFTSLVYSLQMNPFYDRDTATFLVSTTIRREQH
jgi:hypothetical protein